MNTFLEALETELNITETENGAKAYKSTRSRNLDLFGQISACRHSTRRAVELFCLAFAEHPETAVRILFWSRDIRGGQGERNTFREVLKELADIDPKLVIKLLDLVPEYGRYDDWFSLEGTPVWRFVLLKVREQLFLDQQNLIYNPDKPISLLAKWLPSINASSPESKRIGREIAAYVGWSERQYRKTLSRLRSRIKIVEQAMCAREWSAINYSQVPSQASLMYRNAFAKRDGQRYSEYLGSVNRGDSKINTRTLHPYEIVSKYLKEGESNNQTLNLLWESLPNYMGDNSFNGLVVADVSGSMKRSGGMPLAVSISLAMYISERNTGYWKDKFLTFSKNPEIQVVSGGTLSERVKNLSQANWGRNTNLQAVFDLILKVSVRNNIPDCDMPRKLMIVSDMQFDESCNDATATNFETLRSKYESVGYTMPELVFWNVRSSDNVPMQKHDTGTCLVSGCSPALLKSVLSGEMLTPLKVMENTVNSVRYDPIGKLFK